MAKFCKNCGAELDEGSVFCNECGASVNASTASNNLNSVDNPFNRYNVDMIEGEQVIRSSMIHVGCLYLPLILTGIGLFWGIISLISILSYSYYYPGPCVILIPFLNPLFIIGIIWFIIRYIGYKNNDLILTNKRVFGKCGLIFTTLMQCPLEKIDSVSFSQGIVGKIIGYGTVQVYTTSSRFKFRFIQEGHSFYNDIFNQLEITEKEKRQENADVIVEAFSKKLD